MFPPLALCAMLTTLFVAYPAAAQEADVGASCVADQYCGPHVSGVTGYQYGGIRNDGLYTESPAMSNAADRAVRDASDGAKEGVRAFKRGVGSTKLAREPSITRLPDTGGPSPALIAGLALVACGAVVWRVSFRR